MKFLSLFTCALMVLSSVPLIGQHNTVKGFILNTEKGSAIDCVIEVFDIQSNLLSSTTLGENNYFEITIDTSYHHVFLYVSRLGCDYYIEEIDFMSSTIHFSNITLRNCNHTLDSVLISAERLYIKERGDTLIFDVKGFTSGADQSLGDVLRKMPGIEVTENNQINYQGKRVKEILISNKNILNDQHQLALDAIKVDDIKSIQIIHDYKPFFLRFSQTASTDVAMNVELKKSALDKLRGEAEGVIGIHKKYKVDVDVYSVDSDMGLSFFTRSNNVGRKIINPLEYLGLMTGYQSLDNVLSKEHGSLIPIDLLPSTNAYSEYQNILSSSSDFNIGNKTSVRFSILGVHNSVKKDAEMTSQFFDTDNTFSGIMEESDVMPSVSLFGKLKTECSKNVLFEMNFIGSFSHKSDNNKKVGMFNSRDSRTQFVKGNKHLNLSPNAVISLKHNNNTSSIHTLSYEKIRTTLKGAYTDESNVVEDYEQNLLKNDDRYVIYSELEHRHGDFLLKVGSTLEHQTSKSTFLTDDLGFFNNKSAYIFHLNRWQPSLRYGLDSKEWKVHGSLGVDMNNLKVSRQYFSNIWINPKFVFQYKWNMTEFVGFTIGEDKKLLDPYLASGFYFIKDHFVVSHTDIMPGQFGKSQYLQLYYFNANSSKRTHLSINSNFSIDKYQLSSNNLIFGNFMVSEALISPRSYVGNLRTSYRFSVLKKRVYIKMVVDAKIAESERMAYQNITSSRVTAGLRIATNNKKFWDGGIEGKYGIFSQDVGRSLNTFSSYDIILDGRMRWKKWHYELSYNWNFIRNNSLIINHIFDFELAYSYNSHWYLILEGIDVFSMKDTFSSVITKSAASIDIIAYRRLPGALMAGVRYKL